MTRRALRLALGVLWLLDAGLQFQPYMFGRHFANDVIMGAAAHQPDWVSGGVHLAARLTGAAPIVVNSLFGLVQLGIGAGLLWRRTARLALAASIVWSLGVWYFGEGLGGLAGGHASLLTGLPGAASLYAALAFAAFPRRHGVADTRTQSAFVLAAWVGVWVVGGLFEILPGRTVAHSGIAILAAAEMVIGVAAVSSPRIARVGAVLGGLGAIVIWVVGEGFGQLATGQATDPNSGPLLLLMAASVYSNRLPARPFIADGARLSPATALRIHRLVEENVGWTNPTGRSSIRS